MTLRLSFTKRRQGARRGRLHAANRHGSRGRGLYAGRDQRAVRCVATTTRCRTLSREGGRIPGGTAIGNEKQFIVAALSRAACRVAVGADDPHCRGHSRWSRRAGLASLTRWTCRPRVALRDFRPLPASGKNSGQGDNNQSSIQLNTLQTRAGRTGGRLGATRIMPLGSC